MDRKLGRLSLVCAVLALGACAHASDPVRGPNGRPLYTIGGGSTTGVYEKANEKCPGGYDIVRSQQQGQIFILDIECK